MEATNVDSESGVNVEDLTYLADYLFFGGLEAGLLCDRIDYRELIEYQNDHFCFAGGVEYARLSAHTVSTADKKR